MGWEEWASVESGGRCHSLGLRSWTRICCLKSWSCVESAWSGLQIVPCVSLCQFHSASLQGRNISKYEICMFSVERWHVTTNCLYSLWHWEANRLIKEGTGNNKKQFSSQAEASRTWSVWHKDIDHCKWCDTPIPRCFLAFCFHVSTKLR